MPGRSFVQANQHGKLAATLGYGPVRFDVRTLAPVIGWGQRGRRLHRGAGHHVSGKPLSTGRPNGGRDLGAASQAGQQGSANGCAASVDANAGVPFLSQIVPWAGNTFPLANPI